MLTRTSRLQKSSLSLHQSRPITDTATQSSLLQTSSPRTSRVYNSNINYRLSDNTAYQMPKITFCQTPKDSSIVARTVCCSRKMLKSSLDPFAIKCKLLGDVGQFIRMIQLSLDSWMLLGYRYYDDDGLRSFTPQSADRRQCLWKRAIHEVLSICL